MLHEKESVLTWWLVNSPCVVCSGQRLEAAAAHDQKPRVSLSVTQEEEGIHVGTGGQAGGSPAGE